MPSARAVIALLLGVFLLATVATGQTQVDSSLQSYINGIRAIDSHAHPMRPVAPGAPADTEFDALPLDAIPPFSFPARLEGTNPIWRSAQAGLYAVPVAAADSLYKER